MNGEILVPPPSLASGKAARERVERVCLRTYSLETVKHTCYRFASRHHGGLSVDETSEVACVTFRFPVSVTVQDEERVIELFHQDLLDQDLRTRVSERTEVVRNLILANAFANTSLTGDED